MTLSRGRGPRDSRIMLVGEAWGRNEEEQGLPFVGPAGKVLEEVLLKSGINPEGVYYSNLINARPPGNDLSKWYDRGLPNERVTEGLLSLADEIEEVNPNVIIPLGNWPLFAFYGQKLNTKWQPTGILDYRGYVLEARKLARGRKIIPTVHPSYLLQGGYSDGPLAIIDLKRAKRESAYPDIRRLTPRRAIVDPRGAEREALRTRLLSEGRYLFVDIEYIGSRLLCIGFAVSPEWSVTIRIRSPEDVAWCRSLIESGRPLGAQNAMYDFGILEWHYQIEGFKYLAYDTMVAAYVLNIEYKKDLGALACLYTDLDAWWDVIDWNKIKSGKQSIEDVFPYNGTDCMATVEICEKQIPELQSDPKMWEAFQFDMRKIKPLWEISRRGVRIDTENVANIKIMAEHQEAQNQAALNLMAEAFGVELGGLDLNVKSGKQMVAFFEKLGFKTNRWKRTESGNAPATDNITLMEAMRKADADYQRRGIELVLRVREARDLQSKFLGIEWDDDGRARCTYDGTKTGTRRLSSKTFFPTDKGSNLQNIPAPGSSRHGEIVRCSFVPDPGYEFAYADLKGAEFLVVAELTQDPLMLKYAQMSITGQGSVHKETAAFIFSRIRQKEIKPEDISKESPEYFLGKKTRHSGNYMVGPKELMGRINALGLETGVFVNMAEMKLILHLYTNELHPGLPAWWDEVIREATQNGGMLRNLFGYPRIFHDRLWSSGPELVAFKPQSTVGDTLNYGLVACHDDYELAQAGYQDLLQVHDAIGFQYPIKNRDFVLPRVEKLMQVPIKIPKTGKDLIIPIEIACGRSWGELETWHG